MCIVHLTFFTSYYVRGYITMVAFYVADDVVGSVYLAKSQALKAKQEKTWKETNMFAVSEQ